MSKRKYTKGRTIWTLDELVEHRIVYFWDKPIHRGWFQNLQIRTARGFLLRGAVCEAIPAGWRRADNETTMQKKEVRRPGRDARSSLRSRQQKSQ